VKILAFDTSTYVCSVALQDGDHIRLRNQAHPMQQAMCILPMIQELLESSSLTLSQLDAIAYGCGPGSFTGLRIASSVAQGLGFVTGLPVIAVSSLAALAQTAFLTHRWEKLLIAVDARSNQIYFATYEVNAEGYVELIGDEKILPSDQLPSARADWYGVGNGWHHDCDASTKTSSIGLKAINSSLNLSAHAILILAQIKFARGDWLAGAQALPCYLI